MFRIVEDDMPPIPEDCRLPYKTSYSNVSTRILLFVPVWNCFVNMNGWIRVWVHSKYVIVFGISSLNLPCYYNRIYTHRTAFPSCAELVLTYKSQKHCTSSLRLTCRCRNLLSTTIFLKMIMLFLEHLRRQWKEDFRMAQHYLLHLWRNQCHLMTIPSWRHLQQAYVLYQVLISIIYWPVSSSPSLPWECQEKCCAVRNMQSHCSLKMRG